MKISISSMKAKRTQKSNYNTKSNFLPLKAIENVDVWRQIKQYLLSILDLFDYSDVDNCIDEFEKEVSNAIDRDSLEEAIAKWYKEFRSIKKWTGLSKKRALIYAKQYEKLMQGNTFLDVGCGNGLIGSIVEERTNYIGNYCDTLDYRIVTDKPFFVLKGDKLPLPSASYDTVILSTVLHHARKPDILFEESYRVARKRIIIKESVYGIFQQDSSIEKNSGLLAFINLNHEQQFLYTCFVDWFYNCVLERDIDIPFNFRQIQEWQNVLNSYSKNETTTIHLGFDDRLGALYHVLFVVNVNKKNGNLTLCTQ